MTVHTFEVNVRCKTLQIAKFPVLSYENDKKDKTQLFSKKYCVYLTLISNSLCWPLVLYLQEALTRVHILFIGFYEVSF